MAAVARPLTLWVCGLWRSSLGAPSSVRFGWAFALLGLAIAGCALALAIDFARERNSSLARHAALVILVAVAAALRVTVGPLAIAARARGPAQRGQPAPPARDPLFPDYPRRGHRGGTRPDGVVRVPD